MEKSDRIAKRDGTYVPKDRRKKKRDLATSNGASGEGGDGDGTAKKIKLEHDGNAGGVTVNDPSSLVSSDAKNLPSGIAENASSDNIATETPPSNILFAEGLPKDCNEMMLACLFRSYPGYKEVRIPRTGLAFIEFDDEPQATVALKALNGFNLADTETLNLKYGKA